MEGTTTALTFNSGNGEGGGHFYKYFKDKNYKGSEYEYALERWWHAHIER
jgi:hypothetical protein